MNNKKINKVISTLINSGIINKTNIWIKAAKHLQMLLIAVPIFITSLKKVFEISPDLLFVKKVQLVFKICWKPFSYNCSIKLYFIFRLKWLIKTEINPLINNETKKIKENIISDASIPNLLRLIIKYSVIFDGLFNSGFTKRSAKGLLKKLI